jgi:tetratricopeptide (TPR) repeat protein
VGLSERSISLTGGNQWYKRLILGRLYQNQEKPDKALEQLKTATNLNPACAQCRYYLAKLLCEMGSVPEAKQHLTEFFQLHDREEWEEEARVLMRTLRM